MNVKALTMETNHLSSSVRQWLESGEHKKLNGNSIFTIDQGNADLACIVLIHGFPTSSWDWHQACAMLRHDYRVVSLDMLGFGFSDKPNRRNYSIAKQADLFEALFEELELSEYHVFAHDYGDTVAQELLARQIDGSLRGKALSYCFLNGGLFPETHRPLLIQKLMLGPLGSLINRFTGFRQFAASFSSVFGKHSQPSENELREFWELININDGKHVFHNLITYINDRSEHRARWVSALQESPVPISLINGSVDPVSGKHMVERYRELKCRLDHLVELPEIGHYPQTEAPQAVVESYRAFLSSLT